MSNIEVSNPVWPFFKFLSKVVIDKTGFEPLTLKCLESDFSHHCSWLPSIRGVSLFTPFMFLMSLAFNESRICPLIEIHSQVFADDDGLVGQAKANFQG